MSIITTALADVGALTYTDLEGLNLFDVVYLFASLAILGAGLLSIIFIFFGGFSFILSGGDESKVKSAIHTIRYAIIGLVISLLSLVFVPMIGRLFGVNFNFFDFATLSNRINALFTEFQYTDPNTHTNTQPRYSTPEIPISDLIK
jgi:hypothetical protein